MKPIDDIPIPVNRVPGQFMQQLRTTIREQLLAWTTEKTYVQWVRSFIRFHRYRHPREMGAVEVDQFLSWLDVTRNVAPATQSIALNALVFLYKRHLRVDIGELEYRRARPKRRIPVVLTHEEAMEIIVRLPPKVKLFVEVLYGAGLRQAECCMLRVKDIDFGMNEIVVRQGKGGKDRRTVLPSLLCERLAQQVDYVRA